MNLIAIILVLSSGLLQAVRDFLTKKHEGDKQIFVWWFALVSLVITFPVVIYSIATQGFPSLHAIFIPLGVGIIHFCYWIFYSKSYEGGELSHVFPIMRASPAFVLLFAIIFLKEKVSIIGIIGIIAITIGLYLINLKGWQKKHLLEPIASFRRDRHVQFAFLTLITVTAYSLFDKIGVSYLHPITYAFLLTVSALTLFSIYLFVFKKRSFIYKSWQENKKLIIYNGVISSINYPLLLLALTFSNVSYVNGLRQISVVIATILGGHLLKEKHKSNRLAASIIIFAGAIMISAA